MQPTPHANPLIELVGQFIDASKAFWRRRTAVNELGLLSAPEIAYIERDLGISAAELCVLANKKQDAADLLIRRLETLRLEPSRIEPSVMRDLQRCCSNCDSKQLCVHELEDKPRGATWPKYCSNEQTITALLTEQKIRN